MTRVASRPRTSRVVLPLLLLSLLTIAAGCRGSTKGLQEKDVVSVFAHHGIALRYVSTPSRTNHSLPVREYHDHELVVIVQNPNHYEHRQLSGSIFASRFGSLYYVVRNVTITYDGTSLEMTRKIKAAVAELG